MLKLSHWLTDWKIPIGKSAKRAFDWLQDVGEPFFDWLSWLMEGLINGILAVLQIPPHVPTTLEDGTRDWVPLYPESVHALVVTAVFVGLTWALQRV